jgi:hypothetical protein
VLEEAVDDADFSDAFCRFVQSCLPTFEAAELLVELFRNPGVALPEDPRAAKHLALLRTAGLLDEALRYAPASEELRRHVETLATAYNFVLYAIVDKNAVRAQGRRRRSP